MNTSKQINIMVALVFAAVIAAGAYTIWDPHRAADAQERQLDKAVDRGAFLFSQNCRVCHGDKGEGGQAANRLTVAPPLNRTDLQGVDPKTGELSSTAKTDAYKRVYYTIACGRVGRSMPTWSQAQGGPLNDEQIKQLAVMITEGTGWDTAQKYAAEGVPEAHIHGDYTDGLKLVAPLDAFSILVLLNSVDVVAKGDRLQIDQELMTVTGVNKDAKNVTVDRALGTTKAAAHENGALVAKPPVPPDPPAITGKDSALPCGQVLPPAAAAPSGTPGAAQPAAELKIVAQGIQFDTATLAGAAGKELTITFDNNDAGTLHNFHVFKGADATGESVAKTDFEAGVVTQTLKLGPLDAGAYYYQCDVHPQMNGVLTVQ